MRKRERATSEADKAPKSPRPNVGGKSLASMGLQDVLVAAAPLSDSSGSSEETTSSSSSGGGGDSAGDSGRCHHMRLDSEDVDMAVFDINTSEELPTCHHPGCGITWKGAGEDKEGMMQCLDCHYIACARGLDREDPRGHALWHAANYKHYIAQWYDVPNLGYCFKCVRVMRLSDNQDLNEDECAEEDRKVKDQRAMVASKTVAASKSKDNWGTTASSPKVDWPTVASSSKVDLGNVARNALDQWGIGAGNDAAACAIGNGYIIRGMLNHGNTCYMNASLQCLLALVTYHSFHGLGLGVPSKASPARSKPLQVDSTEVKDVVQSRMQTQKNDVPQDIIEVPIDLDFIPNLFDDFEEMEESAADSHNRENKENARGSDIVHDEAKHIDTLGSIEDCLTLFSMARRIVTTVPSSEDKDNSSYRLVGVIVHHGNTPNDGHYIAYVWGSGSSWFCASDTIIREVSLEEVLGCEAYILFYERMNG
ncbi:hypothetical protein ACQ4PT_021632 [Festuca glaucescens]